MRHAEENIFDKDLKALLEELALNISRGLDRLATVTRERQLVAMQFQRRNVHAVSRKTSCSCIGWRLRRIDYSKIYPGAMWRGRKFGGILTDLKNMSV